LHVEFTTPLGKVNALNGVSFDVPKGKVLGIVGESGCGKSVTSRAIMQILEKAGKVTEGEILFRPAARGEGDDDDQVRTTDEVVPITSLDPRGPEMRKIRGEQIAMIFQEPMTSLNPVY